MPTKAQLAAQAAEEQFKEDGIITEELLIARLPPGYKLPKSNGDRADLLYQIAKDYKEKIKPFDSYPVFESTLKNWFIRMLKKTQEGGSIGSKAKVKLVSKDAVTVIDWAALYAHIIKKKDFDLLNKAVNTAAVKKRWDDKKKVPGVDTYPVDTLSITKK